MELTTRVKLPHECHNTLFRDILKMLKKGYRDPILSRRSVCTFSSLNSHSSRKALSSIMPANSRPSREGLLRPFLAQKGEKESLICLMILSQSSNLLSLSLEVLLPFSLCLPMPLHGRNCLVNQILKKYPISH